MTRSPLRSGRAERDQKSFSLFRGQQKSRQGFLHNERAAARCARLCASLSPLAAQLMSIAADATNNCPPVFALLFSCRHLSHVARAEKERYIFRNARHVCVCAQRDSERKNRWGETLVCVCLGLCLRVCFFALPFSTPRRHPPRPRRRRTRRRPPRSPSRARRGPREPRRTHPPPYPRRRTSARRRAWST